MSREEEMWEAVEQEHGDLSKRESFVTLTAFSSGVFSTGGFACFFPEHPANNATVKINANIIFVRFFISNHLI